MIGPDGKIIGRVMKPGGGAEHRFWAMKMVVRPPPRGSRTAPTRDATVLARLHGTWFAELIRHKVSFRMMSYIGQAVFSCRRQVLIVAHAGMTRGHSATTFSYQP